MMRGVDRSPLSSFCREASLPLSFAVELSTPGVDPSRAAGPRGPCSFTAQSYACTHARRVRDGRAEHTATHEGALQVDGRVGTLQAAKLHAASVNNAHGLRRTAGDKRRAIEMVISTEEGPRWPQLSPIEFVERAQVDITAGGYEHEQLRRR
jgi:hypothetical protein